MGLFNKFPYTDLNSINLDYTLNKLNDLYERGEALYTQLQTWQAETTEDLASWKADVEAGLAEWKTATEGSLNNKFQQLTNTINAAFSDLETQLEAHIAEIETTAVNAASAASASATAAAESASNAADSATAAAGSASDAEATAESLSQSLDQIATNTSDITDLKGAAYLLNSEKSKPYRIRNAYTKGTFNGTTGIITTSTTWQRNASIDVFDRIDREITFNLTGFRGIVYFWNDYTTFVGNSGYFKGTKNVHELAIEKNFPNAKFYKFTAAVWDETNDIPDSTASPLTDAQVTNIFDNTFIYSLFDLHDTINKQNAFEQAIASGLYKLNANDFDNIMYIGSTSAIESRRWFITNKKLIYLNKGNIIKWKTPTVSLTLVYFEDTNLNNPESLLSYGISADYSYFRITKSGYYIFGFRQGSSASPDLFPEQFDNYNIDVSIITDNYYKNNYIISVFGDSISAGQGTNKTYFMYLEEDLGYICNNFAYGGSGYVRNYPNASGRMGIGEPGIGVPVTSENMMAVNNVQERVKEIVNTDGIIIFAGTNDWYHDVTLTQIKTAVENTINYLMTNFPQCPIWILSPIHRADSDHSVDYTNNNGNTIIEFSDAIKETCIKMGVHFIDIMQYSGLNPHNAANKTYYFLRDDTQTNDGLHPNHFAHARIEKAIREIIKNDLEYYNILK